MVTLKELKEVLADVNATKVRFGGFCDDYSLLPTQYQIGISEEGKTVCIIDNPDLNGIEGEVFDESSMKEKILSLPEEYDDFDLYLSGVENTNTVVLLIKQIKKTRLLPVLGDDNKVGVCLLGPVYSPEANTVYYTEVVIEDQKSAELIKSQEFLLLLDTYLPNVKSTDHKYGIEEDDGKVNLQLYSDKVHSDMLLAMLDVQYEGVYFHQVCQEETVFYTNDVYGKYWRPFILKIAFADTRDCKTKCDTQASCSDNGEYYIAVMFETEKAREDFINAHRDEIDESVGDNIYRWNREVVPDIMELIIGSNSE